MDKSKNLEALNENLMDLSENNNKIAILKANLFKRKTKDLKERKINELTNIFEQQASLYNQNLEDYKNEIYENIKKYSKQIDEIINAYEVLYIGVFKMLQEALDNQKISIANIVTLEEKINNPNISDKEKKNFQSVVIACIQKKVNYSVIINECEARMDWCIENVELDINEIFDNNFKKLQVYKNDIISKIKRKLFNFISGKNKYKNFINNYEDEKLKDINSKSKTKIEDIYIIFAGVTRQIEKVKKEILKKYEEMLYA